MNEILHHVKFKRMIKAFYYYHHRTVFEPPSEGHNCTELYNKNDNEVMICSEERKRKDAGNHYVIRVPGPAITMEWIDEQCRKKPAITVKNTAIIAGAGIAVLAATAVGIRVNPHSMGHGTQKLLDEKFDKKEFLKSCKEYSVGGSKVMYCLGEIENDRCIYENASYALDEIVGGKYGVTHGGVPDYCTVPVDSSRCVSLAFAGTRGTTDYNIFEFYSQYDAVNFFNRVRSLMP